MGVDSEGRVAWQNSKGQRYVAIELDVMVATELRGDAASQPQPRSCPSILVPVPKGVDGPCVQHGRVKMGLPYVTKP
jgi:hypothetical protein